jgi:hypothetical protein
VVERREQKGYVFFSFFRTVWSEGEWMSSRWAVLWPSPGGRTPYAQHYRLKKTGQTDILCPALPYEKVTDRVHIIK